MGLNIVISDLGVDKVKLFVFMDINRQTDGFPFVLPLFQMTLTSTYWLALHILMPQLILQLTFSIFINLACIFRYLVDLQSVYSCNFCTVIFSELLHLVRLFSFCRSEICFILLLIGAHEHFIVNCFASYIIKFCLWNHSWLLGSSYDHEIHCSFWFFSPLSWLLLFVVFCKELCLLFRLNNQFLFFNILLHQFLIVFKQIERLILFRRRFWFVWFHHAVSEEEAELFVESLCRLAVALCTTHMMNQLFSSFRKLNGMVFN